MRPAMPEGATWTSENPGRRTCGEMKRWTEADKRLLLVDLDDLRVLWDALLPHEASFADVADYDLEVTRRLRERVGNLLAVTFERITGEDDDT